MSANLDKLRTLFNAVNFAGFHARPPQGSARFTFRSRARRAAARRGGAPGRSRTSGRTGQSRGARGDAARAVAALWLERYGGGGAGARRRGGSRAFDADLRVHAR